MTPPGNTNGSTTEPPAKWEPQRLDFATSDERAGFRLHRLEVLNWGTFHEKIWALRPGGDNTLLTGDIGSGKSTLVDAITTLLVPPQKLAYNKAAGAETKERSLRSYVAGHYKSERGDAGLAARPVALRDTHVYSVLLAHFYNEGFEQHVTLAQVFWWSDPKAPPARLYVVADGPLTIAQHFSGFGADMKDLRKKLRATPHVELPESFVTYAAAFRRRFGIEHEQALELFNQTVSMKSVGDLTDFVRDHMLEAFPVEPRVEALCTHFEDLNRAHESVLKAKDQVARLRPLRDDAERHDALAAEVAALRQDRQLLRPWFAGLKAALLDRRREGLVADLARSSLRLQTLVDERRVQEQSRDELKRAIAANGGDRLERLRGEIAALDVEKQARQRNAEQYDAVALALDLPAASDAATFLANATALAAAREATDARLAELQNASTEATVEFRGLKAEHDEIEVELASLRQRRSNIPARMLALRAQLAAAIGAAQDDLPFAGELLQVRDEERHWEGAIERLLHSFGISMLVTDERYAAVAAWVERTHLGERLVYFRVRPTRNAMQSEAAPGSVARKLSVKPDSALYEWLEAEMSRRFDHVCCDDLGQLRRERRAITRAGQIKGGEERHEKDDRHRIEDRSRYVLGWSNEAKMAALDGAARSLEERMQKTAARLATLQSEIAVAQSRLGNLHRLGVFTDFRALDWRPLSVQIARLEEDRRALEAASDVLRALEARLVTAESELEAARKAVDAETRAHATATEKLENTRQQHASCIEALAAVPDELRAAHFPRLESKRDAALGPHVLSVESCENREHDMRTWLQDQINAEDQKIARLRDKIIQAMQAYTNAYPLETREVDVSLEAAGEYAAMLRALETDDLPRFEARFKELLNENTIREVASFQSQLARERQLIKERITTINGSLRGIDYNPGRYIELETQPSQDADVRDFQQQLRVCTEGALSGTEDAAYSEAKFLQVRAIIERFKGREGSAELDRRWTRKVTDVRQWFEFAAVERWQEDGREHEHYSDSGGKSGGQKEKLAYTVLAASLAYQFGLEWSGTRSRSFRFVVIDEAFGRGSDESTRYGLELFKKLRLQLLVVTPLQKIQIIEPYVAAVGFVHNVEGRLSMLRNLTIEEHRAERAARSA